MSAAAEGVASEDANAADAAGPAPPGTAIAPRAPEPRDEAFARSGAKRGGLVSYVSRWRPLKTPRFTLTLLLYLFGLFVAFGAAPPVTVTDAMQERYWSKMDAADAIDAQPRLEAERNLKRASSQTRRANGPLCFFSSSCSSNVKRLKEKEREVYVVAKAYRDAHGDRVRDAKRELGLWSALGVAEAKSLFKKAYENGKVYATRTSYYDTFWLILAGRSDDSLIELLVRWGFQVLANFTVGMTSAVFSFAWNLPSTIASYGANLASAVLFYGVAVVSAASVAFSLLLVLFGTAGGVTYGVVAAAPALARLEQSQRQAERQRMLRERSFRGSNGSRRNDERERRARQDAHLD